MKLRAGKSKALNKKILNRSVEPREIERFRLFAFDPLV